MAEKRRDPDALWDALGLPPIEELRARRRQRLGLTPEGGVPRGTIPESPVLPVPEASPGQVPPLVPPVQGRGDASTPVSSVLQPGIAPDVAPHAQATGQPTPRQAVTPPAPKTEWGPRHGEGLFTEQHVFGQEKREAAVASMGQPPPPAAPAPPEPSLGRKFAYAAGEFLKGIPSVPLGAVESIAIIAEQMDKHVPKLTPEKAARTGRAGRALAGIRRMQERGEIPPDRAQEGYMALRAATARVRQAAERLFPTDPQLQDDFVWSVLPSAFGSAFSFIGTQLLTGGGAMVAGAGGAAMEAAEAYREAEEAGLPEDMKLQYTGIRAVLGATEAFGVGGLLGRLMKRAGMTGVGVGREMGRAVLREAPEEALQEAVQTGGGLLAAREFGTLPPDADIAGLTGKAMAAGGIVGGVLGAGGVPVSRVVAGARRPVQPPLPGVDVEPSAPGTLTPGQLATIQETSRQPTTAWGLIIQGEGGPWKALEDKILAGQTLTPAEAEVVKEADLKAKQRAAVEEQVPPPPAPPVAPPPDAGIPGAPAAPGAEAQPAPPAPFAPTPDEQAATAEAQEQATAAEVKKIGTPKVPDKWFETAPPAALQSVTQAAEAAIQRLSALPQDPQVLQATAQWQSLLDKARKGRPSPAAEPAPVQPAAPAAGPATTPEPVPTLPATPQVEPSIPAAPPAAVEAEPGVAVPGPLPVEEELAAQEDEDRERRKDFERRQIIQEFAESAAPRVAAGEAVEDVIDARMLQQYPEIKQAAERLAVAAAPEAVRSYAEGLVDALAALPPKEIGMFNAADPEMQAEFLRDIDESEEGPPVSRRQMVPIVRQIIKERGLDKIASTERPVPEGGELPIEVPEREAQPGGAVVPFRPKPAVEAPPPRETASESFQERILRARPLLVARTSDEAKALYEAAQNGDVFWDGTAFEVIHAKIMLLWKVRVEDSGKKSLMHVDVTKGEPTALKYMDFTPAVAMGGRLYRDLTPVLAAPESPESQPGAPVRTIPGAQVIHPPGGRIVVMEGRHAGRHGTILRMESQQQGGAPEEFYRYLVRFDDGTEAVLPANVFIPSGEPPRPPGGAPEREGGAPSKPRPETAIQKQLREATAKPDVGPPPTMTADDFLAKPVQGAEHDPIGFLIRRLITEYGVPKTPKEIEKFGQKWLGPHYKDIDQVYNAIDGYLQLKWREMVIQQNGNGQGFGDVLATSLSMESKVPPRARSLKVRDQQQFSTPFPVAAGMAWAAAPRAGELVMEPTAGTGNLVEPFAGRDDINLWLSEIDADRVATMRNIGYTVHDGTFFKVLPVSPQVVTMNPPWGAMHKGYLTPPVSTDFKPNDISQHFLVHALRSVAKGGRVVFLVGENFWNDSAAPFRTWLRKHYSVRGAVDSPPGTYVSRGTEYGSVMVVVDKIDPAQLRERGYRQPEDIERTTPANWSDYAEAVARFGPGGSLERPSDEAMLRTPDATTTTTEVPHAEEPEPGEPAGQPPAGLPERRPAPAPGPEGVEPGGPRPGRGVGKPAADPGGDGTPVVSVPPPGRPEPVERAGPPPLVPRVPPVAPAEPGGVVGRILNKRAADLEEARRSTRVAPYAIQGEWGGSVHPRLAVTTASLASVKPPPLKYRPHPYVLNANAEGRISDEQMDAIARAAQNNLDGKGVLFGDATGWGKARQVAGVGLDWLLSGHAKRVLVGSATRPLLEDLMETLKVLAGGDENAIPVKVVDLTNTKVRGKDAARNAEAIAAFPVTDNTLYLIDAHNFVHYRELINRIKPDGLIADEAHKFMNLDAQRGIAWKGLHEAMLARTEKPFFAYSTATAGTLIDQLEYLIGLRAWPQGEFETWLQVVSGQATPDELKKAKKGATPSEMEELRRKAAQGDPEAIRLLSLLEEESIRSTEAKIGKRRRKEATSPWFARFTPAASEQIIRELAEDGLYMSRDLWRSGVEYDAPVYPPSEEKRAAFNRRVALMRDIDAFFMKFIAMNKAARMKSIRGILQFHYKRALFDLVLDDVIALAKQEIATGHQVIIALVSVKGTADEEGQGHLAGSINLINTNAIEKNDDGTFSDPEEIPEALVAKAELMDRLKTDAPALRDPLKTIELALGRGKVGFITGMQSKGQKIVMNQRFQDGALPAVIISDAGGTGISLHHIVSASNLGPAKGRRSMIIADLQWSAGPVLQTLGRGDRAGQLSAPRVFTPHLGLKAQRKFFATIAVRLAHVGAVAKGMEGSTGMEHMEEFELGGHLDNQAVRETYKDLPIHLKEMFVKREFKDPHGPPDQPPLPATTTVADLNMFLLDLQLMPLESADEIMDRFLDRRKQIREDPLNEMAVKIRAERSRGRVIERADLNNGLTLRVIKSESGSEFGILSGRLATSGLLAEVQKHGFTYTGQEPYHRYASVQDLDTGAFYSGVEIPRSRIQPLAKKYGAAVTRRLVTKDNIIETLDLGEKVRVRGAGNLPWVLHRRRDERIQIEGAVMKDRNALMTNKRAVYSTVGNFWFVPEEAMGRFLDAFPIIQEEGEDAASRAQRIKDAIASQFRDDEWTYATLVNEALDADPNAVRKALDRAEVDADNMRIPMARRTVIQKEVRKIRAGKPEPRPPAPPTEPPGPGAAPPPAPGAPPPSAPPPAPAAPPAAAGPSPGDIVNAIVSGDYGAIPQIEAQKEQEALDDSRKRAEEGAQTDQTEESYFGRQDYIQTPMGRLEVRYEVTPLSSVLTSHSPVSFAVNAGYPETVQNRPYHSDKSEQMKVIERSARFVPSYFLARVPTATDGAPIVAQHGPWVLGGNSRAMILARVFRSNPEAWETYQRELMADWGSFGLKEEDFKKVFSEEGRQKGFVLVRRVLNGDSGVDAMRTLARAFNMTFTQALNAEAEAVSRARQLSVETLAWVGNALAEEEGSLADVLRSAKTARELIPLLLTDGVFAQEDINRYTTRSGELNDAGRRAIEQTLLGSVVDDPDLLATARPSLLNKIGKALGALAELKSRPEGWDLGVPVRKALLVAMRTVEAKMSIREYLAQGSLIGAREDADEQVTTVVARMLTDTPRAFGDRFRRMATDARADIEGQATLGGIEAPDPARSFETHFRGQDLGEIIGRVVEDKDQAGFLSTALVATFFGGDTERARRFREAVWRLIDPHFVRAADPRRAQGTLPPQEPITGLYAYWMSEMSHLSRERADKTFQLFRRLIHSETLLVSWLRKEHKEWFRGLSAEDRAKLFETRKGLRRNHDTGEYIFGGLQPADVLDLVSVPSGTPGEPPLLFAVNERLGVRMPAEEAMIEGGRLANGLLIGRLIPDRRAIQLWRVITPAEARARYDEAIRVVPRAQALLDEITAVDEERKTLPLYGSLMPPRSLELLGEVFDVDARRPEEVAYTPSLKRPQPRTFTGRVKRMLHERRSKHRRLKTGVLAETGEELKDISAAIEVARTSFGVEHLRHTFVAQMMALGLEPHRAGDPLPEGFAEWNRGVLKNPDRFMAWASRNREYLASEGIDYKDVIEAGFKAAGPTYRIPKRILDLLGEVLGAEDMSANPTTRALEDAASALWRGLIGTIVATHLLRPSTANRNVVANEAIYGMYTLRNLYRGMLQQIPAYRYEELPFAQFVSDIVAYPGAWTKGSREALPSEALGRTFAMEVEAPRITDSLLGYFHAGDIWSARRVYESVLRAQAHYAWLAEARRTGAAEPFGEFYKKYRKNIPPDVEAGAWHIRDIYGSGGGGDYWNIAPWLTRFKKGVGRALIPYPTYFYKVFTGPMRTVGPLGLIPGVTTPSVGGVVRSMVGGAAVAGGLATMVGGPAAGLVAGTVGGALAPLLGGANWANAFGPDRATKDRTTALANMMASATALGMIWGALDLLFRFLPEPWRPEEEEDLPFGLKEDDLPHEFQTVGRVRLPKWLSDRMGAGPDESFWLRVLDIPVFGDLIAAKAMFKDQYSFGAYLHDRMSMGPLAVMAALMWGWVDRFHKFDPASTRMGAEVGSWGFLGPYRVYARRWLDPYKRRTWDEEDPAWKNFLRAYADTWPGFSRFLEVKHAREFPHQPLRYYPPRDMISLRLPGQGKEGGLGIPAMTAEDLKFWVLNVKPISEGRRRGAIAEALVRRQEQKLKKLEQPWR